jgi:CheY-like chemotaxis protein
MSPAGVILVIEDREDDIILLKRAFLKARIHNPVVVFRSGEAAIWYLAGEGKYSSRTEFPLPRLILLDLKMPEMDGFEVLTWIRSRKELAGIAVIVLTSSGSVKDIQRAYELGANSFIVKETEFSNTVTLAGVLKDYWLGVNKSYESQREPRQGKEDGRRGGGYF